MQVIRMLLDTFVEVVANGDSFHNEPCGRVLFLARRRTC